MKYRTAFVALALGLGACEPTHEPALPDANDEAGIRLVDADSSVVDPDSGAAQDAADDSRQSEAGMDASPLAPDADAQKLPEPMDASVDAGSLVEDSGRFPSDAGASDDPEAGSRDVRVDSGVPLPCPPLPAESRQLFALQHVSLAIYTAIAGSRLLIQDGSYRWALWDLGSRTQIARGDPPCFRGASQCQPSPLQTGGRYFLTSTKTQLEIRSIDTGEVARTLALPQFARYGIASDGSYVWIVNSAELAVWSSTGDALFSLQGEYRYEQDYRDARFVATPSALLVADRLSAKGLLERIAIPSGAVSSLPFLGTLSTWFQDSGHFATTDAGQARIYTAEGKLDETFTTSASLGGWRDVLWSYTTDATTLTVSIRKIGSTTPLWSQRFERYAQLRFSEPMLAIIEGQRGLVHTVDLLHIEGGAATTRVAASSASSFAAREDQWVVSGGNGALYHFRQGNVSPLNCGAVVSSAASPGGTWAFQFDLGRTLLMKLPERQVLRTLDVRPIGMKFASDGALLAVHSTGGLQIIDTASGEVVSTFSATLADSATGVARSLIQFDISRLDGSRVALVYGNGVDCIYKIVGRSADVTYFETVPTDCPNDGYGAIRLSPSGNRWTLARRRPSSGYPPVQVFEGQSAIRTLGVLPMNWVDEDRILVDPESGLRNPSAAIYSIAAGANLAPSYPGGFAFSLTAGNEVFTASIASSGNAKYETNTGNLLWRGPYWIHTSYGEVWAGEGPDPGFTGAFANADDRYAVYGLGTSVFVEPH